MCNLPVPGTELKKEHVFNTQLAGSGWYITWKECADGWRFNEFSITVNY